MGLGVAAGPTAYLLGSLAALLAFVALTLIVGIIALGITAIEVLAGYRGWPQTASLILACLSCSVVVLFVAFVASGGAGT